VEATNALGKKLHVQATPTLVFADGNVVPGAIPTAQLETELANAQAESAKQAEPAAKQTEPAAKQTAAKK
jgi:predicted DsbA family dithiol-disulfide isomerase